MQANALVEGNGTSLFPRRAFSRTYTIRSARSSSLMKMLKARGAEKHDERGAASVMRLRRFVVDSPFATIKYRISGHPYLLLRGKAGARTELSLSLMAYNLNRRANVLGTAHLTRALQRN